MASAQEAVAGENPFNNNAKNNNSGEDFNAQKGTVDNSIQQHPSPILALSRIPTPPTKSPLRASQKPKDEQQTDCVPQSAGNRESSRSPHTSPMDKDDFAGSRIPRGTGSKHPANVPAQKGSHCTSELRSSIPIPIQRRSAEQLTATLQGKQSGSSGGMRLVEKPRGPRPRPSAEPTDQSTPEPAHGADQAQISMPTSMSSSSSSSWDFGDEGDEPERPTNVFTGEYRTRTLSVPGNHAVGPTLRIATSADDVIMGGTIRDPPNYAVTQRTNPAIVRYFDKLLPSTPNVFTSSKSNTPASESKKSIGGSQGSTRVAPNFCRPHISLDSLPRRDISGKEMSISRKPVSKPSLSSLFSPSSKSLRIENEPLVPKIRDEYCTGQEPGINQSNSNNQKQSTPAKIASESKATSATSETKSTHTPITAIKVGTFQSHPPRTSSLQTLSALPNNQCHAPAIEGSSGAATNFKRNITFNDIIPLTLEKHQVPMEGGKSKIPESRSTHLLGSFRNIFKTRISVERTKRDGEASETTEENQAPQNEHAVHDRGKNAKAKPKYTRISGGVSWSKSTHNPKSPVSSPTTPTPSVPRLLAPPNRHLEDRVPSFARPTKSTRTKATSGLRTPTSTTPEVRPRRPHIRTASSGSPQRVTTGTRRAAPNLLALSGHKKNTQSLISEPKIVPVANESACSLPKHVDAVRSCLDTLCKKVSEATAPLERDRHIRLALNLQQQLGDYQNIEKGALEAEEAAKGKQSERKAAEDCLNTTLAEIMAQLDEN